MSEQDKKERWGLIIPFLDKRPGFVHGYECGMVDMMMDAGLPIDRPVHRVNEEQIRLIAKYYDYKVDFENCSTEHDPDGAWCRMIGAPIPPEQKIQ